MPLTTPRLVGPWRRRFQWATTLTLLAVPFVRIDGRSLLLFDLPDRTLEAGGRIFRIEELYLLLLLSLSLVLFFLLVTLVLGRVWCGWACPQTTLSDAAEWWGRRIGLRVTASDVLGASGRKALLHAGYLFLSLLAGANMVWYFVSPYDFFPRLAAGRLGAAPLASWLIIAGAVYLDLALLRRLLCRDFCPYGRFQSALVDAGTLNLRFHPGEAHRCIGCGSCVRACPTGIDIRRGDQVECINCGRCLDACRETMATRNEPGIIRYTFGREGKGPGVLLNARILLVAALFITVSMLTATAVAYRPSASLKLQRSASASSRPLPGGKTATFFTAYLSNRGDGEETFTLSARRDDADLELKGPVHDISLSPGERRKLDFAVVSQLRRADRAIPIHFSVTDSRGTVVSRARALLSSPKETSHE
jgi:cytochrome c oxidase accessory protein FixG